MSTDSGAAPVGTPTISVVLPTHNRLTTLGRAIQSVLAQSFSQIELIVVDDGSTDGTAEFLRASVKGPRVRVIMHSAPRGPGAARNAGVRAARADWVAFQDSDDVWWPQKLERQWQCRLENPRLDLICCYARDLDAMGSEVRARTVDIEALRRDAATYLLEPLRFITPTWLVRKKVLEQAGGFLEDLQSTEDWELCLRLSDFARFGGIADTLVDKFSAGPSVFSDHGRRHQGISKTLSIHRQRWLRAGRRDQLSAMQLRFARRMALSGENLYGAIWAARAWRDQPRNLDALKTLLKCGLGGFR